MSEDNSNVIDVELQQQEAEQQLEGAAAPLQELDQPSQLSPLKPVSYGYALLHCVITTIKNIGCNMLLLKILMLIADIGFIIYWLISALNILPEEWLYKDYTNPILKAWNWSFLPLDLAISFTGITSILLQWFNCRSWSYPLLLLSLAFMMASGMNAISYWTIRQEFDWSWWAVNLYLMIVPAMFLPYLVLCYQQH